MSLKVWFIRCIQYHKVLIWEIQSREIFGQILAEPLTSFKSKKKHPLVTSLVRALLYSVNNILCILLQTIRPGNIFVRISSSLYVHRFSRSWLLFKCGTLNAMQFRAQKDIEQNMTEDSCDARSRGTRMIYYQCKL